MNDTIATPTETKLRSRVEKLEADIKLLAKGLKRASEEIEAEWGEEILDPGTEVCGIKF